MNGLLQVRRRGVKPARQLIGLFDQRLGDAVIADVEEPDGLAGMADLIRGGAPLDRVVAEQRSDVDRGNDIEGQELRPHRTGLCCVRRHAPDLSFERTIWIRGRAHSAVPNADIITICSTRNKAP